VDEVAEAMRALWTEAVAENAKADFLRVGAQGENRRGDCAFALDCVHARLSTDDAAQFGGWFGRGGTGADMSHTFNVSTCAISWSRRPAWRSQTWQRAITSSAAAGCIDGVGREDRAVAELARHAS